MLVGSGGVVALVLGAWSALWAMVAVPGASPRSWYPVVFAFTGAIVAFVMLTAQSELVLGMIDWVKADADARAALATETLSVSFRPLWGAGVALAMEGLAVGLAMRSAPEPGAAPTESRPHWTEWLLAVGIVPLVVFDGVVWVAMQRVFEKAVSNGESVLVAVPKLQFLVALGALGSVALLALATLIGLVRMVRA